jgi:glycosyltransferase involved in cell wall biosynthesis
VVARRHEAWVRGAATLAAEREFDAVHAHDFSALPLGAHLAATRGVPLVYDTHEFWSGRPRLSRPTPLRGARERTIERRLGAQAAAVLTVSDSVAEMLRAAYGWAHVHVVRNSFPMVDAGPSPAAVTGAVYAGRIAPYRELETVVAAADALAPLPVTLVGPADPAYLARLHVGRVTVRDALPLDDAVELLRCAGLALVTHSDRWPNHRAALPNKLFLAARAGVPVVATDVAELRRVVTTHRLGRLYRPGDPTDLAAAVREVAADYASYAANVVAARPALSWSRDAEVLLAVYAGLATREDR